VCARAVTCRGVLVRLLCIRSCSALSSDTFGIKWWLMPWTGLCLVAETCLQWLRRAKHRRYGRNVVSRLRDWSA
jgi:hypothetical protein